MKIDRSELISAFMTFALEGNGVVVGHPGVGKTHTLIALREALKAKQIPHLIVPVESLGEATESDIKAFFGRDGDFVQLLKQSVTGVKPPSILMFDGFDSARGEKERTAVLRLIKRCVRELEGLWNVIVSVRIFDAQKSHSLLEIFPNPSGPQQGSTTKCRQFTVPLLNQSELEQALSQIIGLRSVWEQGRPEFKELLRVPFNLWLIERILTMAESSVLSNITSEVQLLELYWEYRVRRASDFEQRNQILTRVAREMVEQHTLSVRKEKVYSPELNDAWNELFSAEVLSASPQSEQRIGFKHNILFDFAVSAQLLENEPSRLAAFIAEDPARPLFLRPSLVYHFTRLWHSTREVFWGNFWTILNRAELHLHQIIRLVLPTIVINEANVQSDLQPILLRLRSSQPEALNAMTYVMQALRVLKSRRKELWAQFIENASETLAGEFAWDAGLNVMQFLEDKVSLTDPIKKASGTVGRNLISWIRSEDRKENKDWLNRLMSLIAVPIVAKTYSTNIDESRRLLEPILGLVDQPNFPIEAVHRLIDELPSYCAVDPGFAAKIYTKVFGFRETSDQSTHMGGFVLPLTSNRRQDYDMCRYSLIQHFPQFLMEKPVEAACAGLEAVQNFAIESHVLPYEKTQRDLSAIIEHFSFREREAGYLRDHSAIWDEQFHHDQEMQLASHVFDWMARSAESANTEKIGEVLDFMADKIVIAALWSRLLSVGANHAGVFAELLFELLIAKPILSSSDARYSLQECLVKIFPLLSPERRLVVEKAITSLSDGEEEENRRDWLETRRGRLIALLNLSLLQTPEAIAMRSAAPENPRAEKPDDLFTVESGFRPWTDEDELKRRGVDLQKPENVALRAGMLPFKTWADKGKDEESISQLMDKAKKLKGLLTFPADQGIVSDAWYQLIDYASAAIQKCETAETADLQFLRDVVLEGSERPEPISDPVVDAKWNSPVWTPAPRNEAAQILPWLTIFARDEEILTAIKRLATDPVPSVRFLLFSEVWRLHKSSSEELYALLEKAIENEKNRTVWQGVALSLWKLARLDKVRPQVLLQKMLAKWQEEADDGDWNAKAQLVGMVVDYAVEGSEWAVTQLKSWRESALGDAGAAAVSGTRLSQYIVPNAGEDKLDRARTLLIDHLKGIAAALEILQNNPASVPPETKDKKFRKLYGVIDQTVSRLYFALDVNPNLRRDEGRITDDSIRRRFFNDALPVLDTVLSFGESERTGFLLAPTAHYFMQLLNGVVRFNPKVVLDRAAKVVRFSSRFNYNLDSLALSETVRLVETLLTDYPEEVREGDSLQNLLEILDAFTRVGWPDALNLVWRLDEIYR